MFLMKSTVIKVTAIQCLAQEQVITSDAAVTQQKPAMEIISKQPIMIAGLSVAAKKIAGRVPMAATHSTVPMQHATNVPRVLVLPDMSAEHSQTVCVGVNEEGIESNSAYEKRPMWLHIGLLV